MRYWKSQAAEAEFRKYNLPYPPNEFQDAWDRHVRRLANDPNRIDRITQMRRVKIGQDFEFITYTHILSGHDDNGSYWESAQAEVGTYPILRPQNIRQLNEEEGRYETITRSYSEEMAYWIPFNPENIERLHKQCVDSPTQTTKRTSYAVMPDGGTEISVDSFNHWANGNFEELYEFGSIQSQEQDEEEKKSTNTTKSTKK